MIVMLIGRVGSILLEERRKMNGDCGCPLSAGLWNHSVGQPRKLTLPQFLRPLQPCCLSLLVWRPRTSENQGGHLLGKGKLAEHGLKIYGMVKGG